MVQMESISNSKYTSMLNEAKERLQAIENELQALRESRVNLKQHAHVVNLFTNEGANQTYPLFLPVLTSSG